MNSYVKTDYKNGVVERSGCTIKGIHIEIEYDKNRNVVGYSRGLSEDEQLMLIRTSRSALHYIKDPTEKALTLHNFLWEL